MVKNNSIPSRWKIEMKKIAKKTNLQVTFSKRRSGLFKKASELCTLCGVDVAIIVFSPAGKVFSFGHPHVESTIDRFLTRNPSIHNLNAHCNVVEAHRDANIRELNARLAQLVDILEVEKRKGQALDEVREAGRKQWWWQATINELGLSELQQLRNALEELKINVGKQADLLQAAVETRNCWPFLAPNGVETSGLGSEGNEVNASSGITQMYTFDPNLYFGF
ncbi:AGAMOUS-like 62 [Hibiscus trionum]|uniref:AGAMOUS-like 62 n=1 Tax=Hibiscus trionum TaxID=183268 RepID=A0A9W7J656_HIBTR|nr:AGAMOUS-like 62 [Hibiscus trionum]